MLNKKKSIIVVKPPLKNTEKDKISDDEPIVDTE